MDRGSYAFLVGTIEILEGIGVFIYFFVRIDVIDVMV